LCNVTSLVYTATKYY